MNATRASEQRASGVQSAPFPGARVLAADDCPLNHDILRQALSRLGIEMTSVTTGAEALHAVRENVYDLVFMDGSMPEMDGFEAASAIRAFEERAARRPVPIVALTGHLFTPRADAWRQAGMSELLAKPFTLKEIRDCLERWLRRSADDTTTVQDGERLGTADKTDRSPEMGPTHLAALIDPGVLDSIRKIAAPEDRLLERVVDLYMEHAPQYLARLEMVDPTNASAVVDAAHALKSLSRNIGALRIGNLAGEIEKSARAGAQFDPQSLESLKAELEPTLGALADFVYPSGRPHLFADGAGQIITQSSAAA
ncbi:MAG: response regulator [Hyphomicrobiaceae bacterium]